MRIAHVVRSLDPGMGGVPRVAAALAVAQAGLGHETWICTASGGLPAGLDQAYGSMPGWDRVHLTDDFASVRKLAASSENACFHLHGVWDPILMRAFSVAQKYAKKHVVTPHGMLDPWCLKQSRLKKWVAMQLIVRRMLKRASFLHVLNDDEARLLGPLSLDAHVMTFPNGVFMEEIPADLGRHALVDDRWPYLLFLGRLHHKKGLIPLAQAFEKVAAADPALRLVVAGPDGGEQARFEAEVTRAGLQDRVQVLGPVYGDDKYKLLKHAAMFVLPSHQEGFSMAITEAMSVGCPVVVSEACHFPEIQAHGAGCVLPLDPNAFAEAILALSGDANRLRTCGQAGAALVAQCYTWPVIAERMLAAYDAS